VDASGKVVAFSQTVITSGDVASSAPTIATVTVGAGSESGTIAATVTPNTAGDTFEAEVSTSSQTTPLQGSRPPSGATAYTSGSNLTAVSGDYLDLYEVNASGKVVGFSQTQLTSSEIGSSAPTTAPTIGSVTIGKGSASGTIAATVTPNTAGDTFEAEVNTSSQTTPLQGSTPPSGASAYTSGANLSAAAGEYLDLYEVNASGKVVGFSQAQLTSSEIGSSAPTTAPTIGSVTIGKGSASGTIAATVTPNTAGDTFEAEVNTSSQTTPLQGSTPPSGASAYTSGSNLAAAAGEYLDLYEVNASGKVVGFSQAQLTSSEIGSSAPTTAPTIGSVTIGKGSASGTIEATVTPNTAGDTFEAEVNTSSQTTPLQGSTPPSGASAYTSGANLPATSGDYLALYEVNGSGQVVAFSQIQLTSSDFGSSSPPPPPPPPPPVLIQVLTTTKVGPSGADVTVTQGQATTTVQAPPGAFSGPSSIVISTETPSLLNLPVPTSTDGASGSHPGPPGCGPVLVIGVRFAGAQPTLPVTVSVSDVSIASVCAVYVLGSGDTLTLVHATSKGGRIAFTTAVDPDFVVYGTKQAPLGLAASAPPAAYRGSPYVTRFDPTGGVGPYTFAIVHGTLPPGLALDPTSGVVRGVPTIDGSRWVTVRVTDRTGAVAVQSYRLAVMPPALRSTGPLAAGVAGDTYVGQVTLRGGTAPYRWGWDGHLPDGLRFAPGLGIVYGVPAAVGTWPFTVWAGDSSAPTPLNVPLSLAWSVAAPAHVAVTWHGWGWTLRQGTSSPLPFRLSNPSGEVQAPTVRLVSLRRDGRLAGGAIRFAWSRPAALAPGGVGTWTAHATVGTGTAPGLYTATLVVRDGPAPAQRLTVAFDVRGESPGRKG